MKNAIRYSPILPLLAAATSGFGADPSLDELEQRCQAAREAMIAPLREEAIEECVAQRRSNRTREDCERIYSDFGERSGSRPPLFNDLPVCIEYFEAKDAERRSSRR